MAKRKGKAKDRVTIASWDMGATGQANQSGLVIESRGELDTATGKVINPNGVKGARRIDTLARYHRLGWISARGYNAGDMLRTAWLNTQRSPGWSDNDRVQSSPKPDQAITMQVDRISRLVWLSRRVPEDIAPIVEHIALHDGSVAGVRVKGKRPYIGRNHDAGKAAMAAAFERLAGCFGG